MSTVRVETWQKEELAEAKKTIMMQGYLKLPEDVWKPQEDKWEKWTDGDVVAIASRALRYLLEAKEG